MSLRRSFSCIVLVLTCASGAIHASTPQLELHTLRLQDLANLVQVEDPRGVAGTSSAVYQQTAIDVEADATTSSIWLAGADTGNRKLADRASAPRPSPDGAFMAFRRDGQIWLLPLRGGEPWQLTWLPEPVEDHAWSPDGAQLVLVTRDPRGPAPLPWPGDVRSDRAISENEVVDDFAAGEWIPVEPQPPAPEAAPSPVEPERSPEPDVASPDPGRPLPRVLRRLQFKEDGLGYLGPRRRHLWTVQVTAPGGTPEPARRLTRGPWDDSAPAWSPDGDRLVFVSDRGTAPDSCTCTALWQVPASGGEVSRLSEEPGTVRAPVWSPDGTRIAYLQTPQAPPVYANSRLRVLQPRPGTGAVGASAELAPELDRPFVSAPQWAPDMTALYVTIEDRGTLPLVRVSTGIQPPLTDSRARRRRGPPEPVGRVQAVIAGPRTVEAFALVGNGSTAVAVMSAPTEPVELFAVPLQAIAEADVPLLSPAAHLQGQARPVDAELRRLTAANGSWRQSVQLAQPEPMRFSSDPDVHIEGWLLRPPGAQGATALPLIVMLHGGPVWQYTWAFSWERQWLAAQGYAVMAINPRGSSGYGEDFAQALWARWGGPDLRDVLAGVDDLVSRGIVDPGRIGVGGWSYGGYLTNRSITRSSRFAAAVSGASGGDMFSAYGTDDLRRWWEDELGVPYDPAARARYEQLSPLRDIAEIRAPTLFLAGEHDWRVPLSQSEQLYAQLRRRMIDGGPETALIAYPGASHDLGRPSYVADRWLRTKAWFDRHLLGDPDADPFFGEWAW